jgi:hypothetical protein
MAGIEFQEAGRTATTRTSIANSSNKIPPLQAADGGGNGGRGQARQTHQIGAGTGGVTVK